MFNKKGNSSPRQKMKINIRDAESLNTPVRNRQLKRKVNLV